MAGASTMASFAEHRPPQASTAEKELSAVEHASELLASCTIAVDGGLQQEAAAHSLPTNETHDQVIIIPEQPDKEIDPHHISQPVTGRLKPAHEIYHQILHDEELQEALGCVDSVLVGYHDRFVGTMECDLDEFTSLEIPFHRVRHYRSTGTREFGGLMWDREGRINNLSHIKQRHAACTTQQTDAASEKQSPASVQQDDSAVKTAGSVM